MRAALAALALLAGCAGPIFPPGAKWEEVSRAGLVTSEGVVADRPPEVFGKDVDGDKVVYQLYAYTDHPERMKEIKSTLIYRIQDLFGNAGITP